MSAAIWSHIDDLIAGIVVIGCFIAIFCHIDGQAWALLGAAAAWCFRSGVEKRAAKKHQQNLAQS